MLLRERHTLIRPRDAVKMIGIMGLAAAVILGAVWGVKLWQDSRIPPEPIPVTATANKDTGELTYQGTAFRPKESVKAYLFMGIDRDGPAKSNQSYIDGGQADVQFLLVVDEKNETWQLLHINRDSMVEVPILGMTGQVIRTEYQQITLAHAYGDGGTDSCRNAVAAVSNMLGGQSIDGYFALNMGAISILNDFVGGVTVTIESDFSDVDPTLVMGQTITLNGRQAYNFIRTRRNVDDQTNLSRMQRHRQYMTGLGEKLFELDQQDVLRGYDAVFDYLVTDMGSKTITQLFEKIQNYTQLDTLTVDGKSYLDEEECNAYALDEESLNQAILTLFYEQK